MAATITAYNHLWKLLVTGGVDLDADTIKLALVTSSYTPDAAHTQWDNGANNATDPSHNEVANGSGYTTGGIALTNPVVDNNKITYDTPVWTSLTKTFRYVVAYKSGSGGGITNPLLFWILPDSTPADVISTGSNYSLPFNATNGLFYK